MKRIQNKGDNQEEDIECVRFHIDKLINMNSISIKKINKGESKTTTTPTEPHKMSLPKKP